jgi:hypothetical protein
MWIFVKDNAIMATAKKESMAISVAKKIRGMGYKVAAADNMTEFLDPEDVWDLD